MAIWLCRRLSSQQVHSSAPSSLAPSWLHACRSTACSTACSTAWHCSAAEVVVLLLLLLLLLPPGSEAACAVAVGSALLSRRQLAMSAASRRDLRLRDTASGVRDTSVPDCAFFSGLSSGPAPGTWPGGGGSGGGLCGGLSDCPEDHPAVLASASGVGPPARRTPIEATVVLM